MTEAERTAARAAWAYAIRHPVVLPDAKPKLERQRMFLGDLVMVISLDEEPGGGRFARISVARAADAALPPPNHDEVVELVAEVYLLGRFTPFPVSSIIGADGATLHYALDLESFKASRAQDLYAEGHALLRQHGGTSDPLPADAEQAAIELALPLEALVGAWNRDAVLGGDARARMFLSDRFLVPAAWVDTQVAHYRAALVSGEIDESGRPGGTPPLPRK